MISRNKAILIVSSVIVASLTLISLTINIWKFRDTFTNSSYIRAVKERKAKLDMMNEDIEKLAIDIHKLRAIKYQLAKSTEALKKDYRNKDASSARECIDAINMTSTKIDKLSSQYTKEIEEAIPSNKK